MYDLVNCIRQTTNKATVLSLVMYYYGPANFDLIKH